MQLFTIHDVLYASWLTLATILELRGVIAENMLRLIFLPLHELSIASSFVSAFYAVTLWRNKGLIISALTHMFHVFKMLTKPFG